MSRTHRRRFAAPGWLCALALLLGGGAARAAEPHCAASQWPMWEHWAESHVQADGRMLGSSLDPFQSSSEGQSYGMLFALIGNDPQRFEQLWKWTADNLMGADTGSRLAGWLWGRDPDGRWRLLDANSASDADLWIIYSLLEASRIWQRPAYRTEALRMLKTLESTLVVDLPGVGKMLLPGPVGYVHPDHLWRLNLSYLPVPLLRRLAKEQPAGPWKEIADNTAKVIRGAGVGGYVADWVGYRGTSAKSGLYVVDPFSGPNGSYDAIRIYLWAGVTPKADPLHDGLLAALGGMEQSTASKGVPPEKVDVPAGKLEGEGPFGFSAALVPYFIAKGQPWLAEQQQRRVEAALANSTPLFNGLRADENYYSVMLSLFGLGWAEQRYQFREDGTLKLSWEAACSRIVRP